MCPGSSSKPTTPTGRERKDLTFLSNGRYTLGEDREDGNMKTYIDPVCGMTVGESALRAEGYDDVAFCAPGCRAAFLANPSAYAPESAAATSKETPEGNNGHDH